MGILDEKYIKMCEKAWPYLRKNVKKDCCEKTPVFVRSLLRWFTRDEYTRCAGCGRDRISLEKFCRVCGTKETKVSAIECMYRPLERVWCSFIELNTVELFVVWTSGELEEVSRWESFVDQVTVCHAHDGYCIEVDNYDPNPMSTDTYEGDTKEEAWLMLTMDLQFNKRWDGEDWVANEA